MVLRRMTFQPQIIVEATAVCDRVCTGCYAPNAVSRESIASLYEKYPNLFLNSNKVKNSLESLVHKTGQSKFEMSVRGGEPTRHPKLGEILVELKKFASRLFLETHGRWIVYSQPDETLSNEALLGLIAAQDIVVKISFDKMHGLSVDELHSITNRLDSKNISWCVAITEENEENFLSTATLVDWISSEQLIFQKKASRQDDLIKPELGVIKVRGLLAETLSTKTSFKDLPTEIHFCSRPDFQG